MERSWPADAELLARAVAAGPGGDAMGLLVQVRAEHLDLHDQVTLLATWAAQDGWLTARRTAAVVAVAGAWPKPSGRSTGDPRVVDEESVTAEVACALRVSDATATALIATARALHGPLAAALPAVASGRWGFGHLRMVETELAPQVQRCSPRGPVLKDPTPTGSTPRRVPARTRWSGRCCPRCCPMRPATRPGGCDDVSERRWPGSTPTPPPSGPVRRRPAGGSASTRCRS